MSMIKYHELIRDYDEALDPQINVQLLDEDLWEEVFVLTNEMYSTNLGSSLVPELRIRITGLDPFEMYAVCAEFELRSNFRWKYVNGSWTTDQTPAFHEFKIGFMHPDSYQNGFGWMERAVTFNDMRISVNEFASRAADVRNLGNMVFLNPYSKYRPVIKVFKLEEGMFLTHKYSKSLDVCQFITVIAYQNSKMIEKKGRVVARKKSRGTLTFPNEEYIRDLATFVPKTLRIQDMKSIDFIWSSALFSGGNRMNFFTFVELYQIKADRSSEGYSLKLFINEIENNNLDLPNVNLNMPRRSEISQPAVAQGGTSPARAVAQGGTSPARAVAQGGTSPARAVAQGGTSPARAVAQGGTSPARAVAQGGTSPARAVAQGGTSPARA
ncbi:Brachyury protein-like A, partial [Armadillidium vulgare]